MNEVAALPITGGSVVRSAQSVHMAASDAHPAPRPLPGLTGYRAGRSDEHRSIAGPGRASPVPAVTFQTFNAPYAGRFLRAALPGSSPLPWPSPRTAGLGSSSVHPKGRLLTTRQVSLDAADRLVAPPEGLLTLGFDPTRFQTEPPACYRASWQLPGRDSHPLATTSLCWITIYISTSNSGRTRGK
jgi:hypothetical protein